MLIQSAFSDLTQLGQLQNPGALPHAQEEPGVLLAGLEAGTRRRVGGAAPTQHRRQDAAGATSRARHPLPVARLPSADAADLAAVVAPLPRRASGGALSREMGGEAEPGRAQDVPFDRPGSAAALAQRAASDARSLGLAGDVQPGPSANERWRATVTLRSSVVTDR